MQCTLDPDCEPVAQNYFQECQYIFNGSWTNDWCPASCSHALAQYISFAFVNFSYSNPFDYCDCNGEGQCMNATQNLFDAGCLAEDCIKLHVEKCESNATCVAVHQEYVQACQGVFNGSDAFCSPECAYQFSQYIPFLTDKENINDVSEICSCPPNSECATYSQNLQDAGCLQSSCGQTWYNCQQDSSCAAIASQYILDCTAEFDLDNPPSECSETCMTSLAAYISASGLFEGVVDGSYCDCQGDAGCSAIQAQLIDIGCIPQNCEYQYFLCTLDADCNQVAMDYLAVCDVVLNGSFAAQDRCPVECMYQLQQYISTVYSELGFQDSVSDYCSCGDANTGCESAQSELDRLYCADPKDCSLNDYICSMDTDCAALRITYFEACAEFINGSYAASGDTYSQCPLDCSDALKAYVAAVYGGVVEGQEISEYCNCNAETVCVDVQQTYSELNCLEDLSTTTLTPETTEVDPGAGAACKMSVKLVLALLFMVWMLE